MNETDAMRRAIALAWRGWGYAAPNPLVGAVVLAHGEVVGEGFHSQDGGPHAEALALEDAGPRARGATLIVSLEPCHHQGRQPPCTRAILDAGIRRVVYAIADPNPVAAGGGEFLSAHDVTVERGLLAEEAQTQNAIFLHGVTTVDRPFIALKLATTVDGKIADRTGHSRWISGPEARDYVHWLRAGFDAIGVGGHTARTDDASLTVRGNIVPRVPPRRIVFDRLADLPIDSTLVRTAAEIPTLVVTTPMAPVARVEHLAAHRVEVIRAATLTEGCHALRQRGIVSMVVEGGGRLSAALLAEQLIDRFYWIQAPVWLGDSGIPAFAGLPGANLIEAERWHPVERRALGEDTLLVMDRGECSPES
ncbi:MAG: bifunctional diaminohydroxyphosphoribosylaminopyrimidine deaminase/5-amino-6-(5-phosphoribosylamino)uracil reductase RibD [Gemmatimonadota bacterium]